MIHYYLQNYSYIPSSSNNLLINKMFPLFDRVSKICIYGYRLFFISFIIISSCSSHISKQFKMNEETPSSAPNYYLPRLTVITANIIRRSCCIAFNDGDAQNSNRTENETTRLCGQKNSKHSNRKLFQI